MPVPANLWTDECIEKLSEMWSAGYTGSVIANTLGRSRCAVIAKANRLGLKQGCIINPDSRPLNERFDHMVEMIAESDMPLAHAAVNAGIRFKTARHMWSAFCNEMGEEFA